jgi:hypothetical protein
MPSQPPVSPPSVGPQDVRCLTRRRFLALGSAFVAATAAGDAFAATAGAPQWSQADGYWALSIGYLEGSDQLEDLSAPWWMLNPPSPGTTAGLPAETFRVVPAADLPLGDQSWADETVEMRVQGLYPGFPPPRRADAFASSYLTVFAPSDAPELPEPVPFLSWGSTRRPGRSPAAPTRFCLPLREDGGLELLVETVMQRQSRHRFYADFTVDWYERPKLQRGLYLLGLAPRLWDVPRDLPDPGERPPYPLCSLLVSFDAAPVEA